MVVRFVVTVFVRLRLALVVLVQIDVCAVAMIGRECLFPPGGITRLVPIKSTRSEKSFRVNGAFGRSDDFDPGMECSEHVFDRFALCLGDEIALIEDEHVAELDLIYQRLLGDPVTCGSMESSVSTSPEPKPCQKLCASTTLTIVSSS